MLGSLSIPHYREQPAAEWGAVYSNFLRKLGHGHLAATVLLPRQEVVVRQVQLPGVADRDLAAALRFQIDSLHPFGDDEAAYGWARVGKTATILVGIARKRIVDEHIALFSEAGIKIHAFTFSAASIYSAVRVLSTPPADGFLAYGQAKRRSGRPTVRVPRVRCFRRGWISRWSGRKLLALAELRLPPETEASRTARGAAQLRRLHRSITIWSRTTFTYATAVASACPWLSLDVNLLPAEQREASSRLLYVPTIVLGDSGSSGRRRTDGVLGL